MWEEKRNKYFKLLKVLLVRIHHFAEQKFIHSINVYKVHTMHLIFWVREGVWIDGGVVIQGHGGEVDWIRLGI